MMKIVNYKNVATGLAESFEVGSRGDRKRRADTKHYTCLNPEVLVAPAKKDEPKVDGKKPAEKSG